MPELLADHVFWPLHSEVGEFLILLMWNILKILYTRYYWNIFSYSKYKKGDVFLRPCRIRDGHKGHIACCRTCLTVWVKFQSMLWWEQLV